VTLALIGAALLVGRVLPTEEKLALFARGYGGNKAVQIAAGRGLQVKRPISGAYLNMHWSPDGSSLWLGMASFRADEPANIFAWTAREMSPVTTLPFGTTQIEWSPDRSTVAIKVDDALYLQHLYSHPDSAQRLTGDEVQAYDPQWSPDGRSLLYLLRRSHPSELVPYYANQVTVREIATGEETTLRQTMNTIYGLYWLPDSRRIAYGEVDDTVVRIYLHDLATGERRPLLPDFPGDYKVAAWSPDGERVAVEAGNALHVADADGGALHPLAVNFRYDPLFLWTPGSDALLVRVLYQGIFLYGQLDQPEPSTRLLYRTGQPVYDARWYSP
jgi:dipeptidyl aminopeptidase/acylaminoacyl peptidase